MSKRATRRRSPQTPLRQLAPVLKLPPDLTLPAVGVLANTADATDRVAQLLRLRPSISGRTVVNAYVLPSLKELGLYEGKLRHGTVTRFGRAVARALTEDEERARELLARQLVAIDAERVGFIAWLLENPARLDNRVRRTVSLHFVQDALGGVHQISPAALDRLGKWVGYLVYFGVLRGDPSAAANTALGLDARHVRALAKGGGELPPDSALRNALLNAYAESTRKVGSRLYIPVALLRDELGSQLEAEGRLLTDAQIDEILRRAPELLNRYSVTFSPFSGPSRGGLRLPMMYAGFMSVRSRKGASSSPRRS